MLRWTDPEIGDGIVDVVVSLDDYVKANYGTEVATANYSGAKPTLRSLDDIVRKLDQIEPAIAELAGHPGTYLRSMTKGFRMFARNLQGDDIPYQTLIDAIQEVPTGPISESKAEWLTGRVEQQLTDLGYRGNLQEKLDAWLSENRIDPERVVQVAEKFLDRSKTGTLSRVIHLPEEDGIDSVNAIRGVFWSGYSKYQGNYRGKLTFNIDRPWYEPVFAQILTHEGYPGHQAFYCRWDYLFRQEKWPLEAAYYLVNSPTNALFEGGPETALHFLGWDDLNEDTGTVIGGSGEVSSVTDDEKRQFRLARDYLDMQRIGMTNACWYVNSGQMERNEAIDYMARVGHVKELEAGLAYRFFTDPIQRTYYPCYYYGRWMVGRAYDAVTPHQRADYFRILYDTPHTTQTFIDAISELTRTPFDPLAEPNHIFTE